MRLSEARKDHYRKLAKDQGYRSRSSYKLVQLNRSYRILQPGFNVIDLGSSPGGWLQVARKEVGSRGKIIGIDIKPIDPISGVHVLKGSIQDPVVIERAFYILGSKADVVLSDLAPNVSGIWDIDHARQIDLTEMAYSIAQKILREGGNAVFKVFEGEMLKDIVDKLKNNFKSVYVSKPDASRQQSSELYVVCLYFLKDASYSVKEN